MLDYTWVAVKLPLANPDVSFQTTRTVYIEMLYLATTEVQSFMQDYMQG